jgi:WD40 repeat protein
LVKAVAFLLDSQILASGSYDQTVRLWEATSSLSFSTDDQYLNTNKGLLTLNPESSNVPNQEQSRQAIFVEEERVTQDGQNILWLPPDYRATCCAVCNNMLVLGHASGQVTFLEFTPILIN